MFERLTRWENNDKDVADLIKEKSDFNGLAEAINRLAAYEDSGLSPEEVQKLKKSDASKEQCTIDQHGEIHRLRDELKRYKQAEQEGRMVLLCKAGTVVYAHSSVAGYDSIISGIVQYFVVHEQFIDLFVLFKLNPNEDRYDFAEYIRADKIGKTVFLTREEAEKALEVGKP